MPTINCRRANVDNLAATLPDPSLTTLLRTVDLDVWPGYAPTELTPGLHQGGTEDYDVLSRRGNDFRRRNDYPFDTVVTLYASAQPVPWGVEELRFGFLDSRLEGDDIATVIRAAKFAHQRWLEGAEVMIRCQAGMNRSGLVSSLVLILAGLTPGQAITLIRQQRGASCLFNEHFVVWLMERAEDALGLRTPSAA